MPVYFGHPLPESTRGKRPEVSSSLKSKGIELLRAAPSDTNTRGIPLAKAVFWGVFESIFSTILFCLFVKKRSTLCPVEQEITSQHPAPLPFRAPPLCVSLTSRDQSGIDFLISNGFEETEIRGNTYYLNSNPKLSVISSLSRSDCPARVDAKCFTPFRFTNLHAMYSVLDLICWFSFASQAMNFTISVDADSTRKDFDRKEPFVSDHTKIDTTVGDDSSEKLDIPAGYHPITKLLRGIIPMTFLDQFPAGEVCTKTLWNRPTYSSAAVYGSSHSGLVMRFVPELASPDSHVVLDFIYRFMFRNIGSTDMDCANVFSQLRSSWGILNSTDFGLELTHLAYCFLIAFEAGVRLTPIFDSEYYEGCVLTGEGFSLLSHNRIIHPLSPKDLAIEVRGMATHLNTLLLIKDIVAREDEDEASKIPSFKSMFELREFFLDIPLTESAKDEIMKVASNLRFPARPWNVNVTSLCNLLDLSRDISRLGENDPIGPRALFTRNSIEVAMSCFGESSCPSFYHPNGTSINLIGSLPSAPREFNRQRGQPKGKQQVSNAAWTFAVRRIRFEEAIGDLRKVLNEKTARSVSSSVARGTGCVVISGKGFAEIFGKLSELCKVLGGASLDPSLAESKRLEGKSEAEKGIGADGSRVKRVKMYVSPK